MIERIKPKPIPNATTPRIPAKTIVPKSSLSILVSFGVTPVVYLYGGIISHFEDKRKGIYKLLQLLHFLTITKRGTKRENHYTIFFNLSIGENPNKKKTNK